jgi:membrane-associated protease RseP (regulator of RpoE activity)
MRGDRKPNCPALFPDFATYRSKYPSLRLARTDDVYARPVSDTLILYGAVQAKGVAEPQSMHALVVSRGPVSARGVIRQSLVLATGDVTTGDDLSDSVVICDGDVRARGKVDTCLIIARGKVTVGGFAATCTLIAGETVTIDKPLTRVVEGLDNVIKEGVAKPLGYITFFELSTVGVEARADGKAVRVAAVTDGGAFALAGVKVGDVVTDVGGKAPDSPEALRRLLRDALALGDATVTVLRDGKPVTATVALPE